MVDIIFGIDICADHGPRRSVIRRNSDTQYPQRHPPIYSRARSGYQASSRLRQVRLVVADCLGDNCDISADLLGSHINRDIADDLLDVLGTKEVTGKSTNKDGAAGKATFVSLLGVSEAQKRAQFLTDEALSLIHI